MNKRAALSGALGATASLLFKLSLSPTSPLPVLLCYSDSLCPPITRILSLLLAVGVNVIMISKFLDGMEESGSVAGTALSTAANFSCSAMFGAIFFEEYVPIEWYFGATLIGIGMWLLSSVKLVTS